MSEQEQTDVITEESSTSTEEESNESSEDSTVESKSVPYERFKEVNEELKRLKQERLDAVSNKGEQKEAPKPESKQGYTEEDLFVIKTLDSVEELERVKKIAALDGVSLREAMQSEDFKFWKQARTEEQKREAASMEASKGSGTRGKKKTLHTPGLTPEEHKALWRRKMGME